MQNSQENSLTIKIIISIVILSLVGGGIYYFFSKSNPQLEIAKVKVKTETTKLNELNTRYDKERATIKQIQDQYSVLRNGILKNTDRYFDDPDSDNPKFLLKMNDKTLEKDINARRLAITKLLKDWDKKMAEINFETFSGNSLPTLLGIIAEAKAGIEYAGQYVNQLGNVVNQLSSNNSELQQTEIYVFESIIEDSRIQLVQVVSVMTTIQTTTQALSQVASSTNTNTSSTTLASSAQNSSQSQNSNTNTVTSPIVTLAQIQQQQVALAQAQAQLALIQQGATTTPTTTTTSTDEPTQVYIPYTYYPTYSQSAGAQTIMEYLQSLPSPNIDRTGWADETIDTSSGNPFMLDGSNP